MLVDVLTNPGKVASFLRKLRISHGHYRKPYGELLIAFFELLVKDHFTPKDIFLWDLLAMERDEVRRGRMSKPDLIRLQQRLNPAVAAVLTEDKGVFSGYCKARGLPVPRLLAVIGRHIGWMADGTVLCHDDQWAAFFDRLSESEIVVKPSRGAYGREVRFLSRRSAGWRDAAGRTLAPAEILPALRSGSQFSDFVIEERVQSHPDLVRLSGTDYLQTTRIVTLVSENKGAEVIFAVMKLIGGSATTDNFSFGGSGNLVCQVALETGRLNWARTAGPGGVGMVEVAEHPMTGATLPQFELPCWREACDLARRAAVQFLPLVTIGWDIAFTPEGPILIEGNCWWDPPNQMPWFKAFRPPAQALLGQAALRP